MSATKTVTIKGWITYDLIRARHPDIFPNGPWSFQGYEPTEHGNPVVCEHTFTAEVPADFDPRPGMVKNLETQKAQVRAEFMARVADLDRQISELQAIEFSGGEA